MSFHDDSPHALTPTSIRAHAPVMSGVYGISNGREWLYIGETCDIQARLLEHLTEIKTLLMTRMPTGFVFEVCAQSERAGRQDRLVSEHEPICNRHWSLTDS
jgi:predicted GIY-YIG superfamily endonuclease